MGLFKFRSLCLCLLLVFKVCVAVNQLVGQIYPGFQASQMQWVEHDGWFLLSKNKVFAFGFYTALDAKNYVLVISHRQTCQIIWTANRGGLLFGKSDKFVFENNGNVYLESGDKVAWSTNTTGERATSMELLDSGNLVLHGDNGRILWQSFSHPTDTLISGQEFVVGMRLKSFPRKDRSDFLEFKSGDLVLYSGFQTPQTYWSLLDEIQKTSKNFTGEVYSARLVANSWNFYDQSKVLLWQFNFSQNSDVNVTWVAKLGSDGAVAFYNLHQQGKPIAEATKLPQNPCNLPETCPPLQVCYFDTVCQCPKPLADQNDCSPPIVSTCDSVDVDLLYVGEKLDYSPLRFVKPNMKTDIDACKKACLGNCSCSALFFENSTGNCFLFDHIAGLRRSEQGSGGFVLHVKQNPSKEGSTNEARHVLVIVMIVIATIVVIAGLLYVGFYYYRKQKRLLEFAQENLEEDSFFGLDSLSGMPVRYTYGELCKATKNFSTKVGQGGFGSVYKGVMPDGAQLAVKKLEGLEEGDVNEILDPKLDVNNKDERFITAVKVALWCIQEEMRLRPPMTKVVQMLEGLCDVPEPPISSIPGLRAYSGFLKCSSDWGTSSGRTEFNSDAHLSDIRLSGPR
ncbi:hypothetical protein COLO4_12957 [Corchorus olitorius]|uniref:S-locus glycoprotein n=1 Tax=Corchorus olitorius TaxID=93759 RepID=A0A1R3JZ07_9ROSI|nr:hypothetical protein COLO4_12957 [Corchorus olitorius]